MNEFIKKIAQNAISNFQIASVPTNQLGSSSVMTQTDIGNLRNMYSRFGKTFQFISNNNITIQININKFQIQHLHNVRTFKVMLIVIIGLD